MFFNKTNQIIELFSEYLESLSNCFDEYSVIFEEIAQLYQSNNKESINVTFVDRIKKLEHLADSKRHEVVRKLLEGGFLVENRKTMMRLIESLDKVADITEDVIQVIVFERIEMEKMMMESITGMNNITKEQLELFVNILSRILTNYEFDTMINDIKKIEAFESRVDFLEDELIQKVFELNIPLADKLHRKQLIRLVASMSDHIEDLSDEVEIIIASRRI